MDYEVKTVIDNIDDRTDIIKNQLNDIAEGFVSVGYYLRKTDETMLYKQKGYKTIYEYAKDTFGIGRSTASRFMEINQKYSKDGYSPEIDLKWSGYGSSKLTEMLGLPEDVQEEFYKTIEGLEHLEIVRPAYAIDYDCIDPLYL